VGTGGAEGRHWHLHGHPAVLRPGRRGPEEGDGRTGDGDEGMGDGPVFYSAAAPARPMMRCCKGEGA